MRYLPPILVLLAVFVLGVLLAWWSWHRRAVQQAAQGIPAPYRPIAGGKALGFGAERLPGVYVTTTLASRPLERVQAHRLGSRARAAVNTTAMDGDRPLWIIAREGAPDLFILCREITEVTTAPGMAGKWIGGDGLVVIRWRREGVAFDTGLRMDSRADHDLLLARGRALRAPDPAPDPADPKETS